MKFFSAAYQAFIPVSRPYHVHINQNQLPKSLVPKLLNDWCHAVEAWEAPYQFPLPLEGRYWDGDFRCDGADAERPCRGGGDGYRWRYDISIDIYPGYPCTLYTLCIQYISMVIGVSCTVCVLIHMVVDTISLDEMRFDRILLFI